MLTWLRRNGSFSRIHSTPGLTSTTCSGPGWLSQGYRRASIGLWMASVFECICRLCDVSHRLSACPGEVEPGSQRRTVDRRQGHPAILESTAFPVHTGSLGDPPLNGQRCSGTMAVAPAEFLNG